MINIHDKFTLPRTETDAPFLRNATGERDVMTPDSTPLFDNPIVMTVVVGLIIGLAGGVLGRLVSILGKLTPAVAFLVSFYLAYGAVPDFPPLASTGKVFFSAVGLVALGLVLDYAIKNRTVSTVCAAIVPAILVVWIGYVRLTNAFSVGLAAIAIVFLVIGAIALIWLRSIDSASPTANRGPVAAISILLALAVGYAPIALVGGSSTGLGLLAGFAAGLGGLGLVQFALPSASLGWTGVLSGLGALLAVNDSVTLINGKMDFLLLALLCLPLFLGQLAAPILQRTGAKSPRLGQLVFGLITLLPSFAVLGLAFLRHADAFHP